MFQSFIIQNIQNARFKNVTNPSPLKDITSDSTSSYEMGKKIFKTVGQPSPALAIKPDKKWFNGGANRDSSTFTARKTYTAIGSIKINSFTSDNNVAYNALARVRSSGHKKV